MLIERGHREIDSGIYAYVLYPGYVGTQCHVPLCRPCSDRFLLPVAILELLIVTRTRLEDRMLKAGLPGYVTHQTKSRLRLIPSVW